MPDVSPCPSCGYELPSHAPEGFCPRCLLRAETTGEAPSVGGAGEVGATNSVDTSRGSVLKTLAATLGTIANVVLRDTDSAPEPPIVRPGRDGGADGSTRYRIDGEIARGGMGTVLKGRDPDLGRDVAIKVLRDDLRDDADMVRRFLEEAQIGGQLHHPGILPIYELGTFADHRPFFSMKLVKGHTLAKLLEARTYPATDLPRFLNIVESVAQTVAYAHARGVIHRDLKPSNVMVGSFGEVLVMDWGLAKVLPSGGVVDDAVAGALHPPVETVIATARSGSGDSELSRAGSVLGTPSYMAPEQARGELDRVDERADVFALGSILCEVLAGKPAFTGRSAGEIQRTAALGDTADALARLDGCGADPELVALAKGCLAREPEDRPRHAGAMAEWLSAYLAGVQDRLRAAELAGVEANARADEERKRRRLTVALSASLVSTAALVGGGWAWTATQRAERATVTGREVNQALAEAAGLRGRAKATPGGDPALLDLSVAEAKRGTSLLARDEGDPELRDRARAFLADVTRERDEARARAAGAERDRQMADRLAQISVEHSSHSDRPKTDADYAAAFRDFGIDVDALAPAEAGTRIASTRIAEDLMSAIDEWIFHRRNMNFPDLSAVKQLIAVADAADSDPWRRRLRDALGRDDRETLRQLAATADVDHLTTENTSRLAFALTNGGDAEISVVLMRAVLPHHRDDFWLNYDLVNGLLGLKPPRVDEALQYATVDAALRPHSWMAFHHLGIVLNMQGRRNEAIAAYREAIRLKPDNALAHYFFGGALKAWGRRDEAIAEYRAAARLDAERGQGGAAIAALGSTLRELSRPDETVVIYRQILEKSPRDAAAHLGLANELSAQGRHDEAVAEYRDAIRLKPGDALAVYYLGNALKALGKRDEAIAEYREAARLDAEWGHVGSAIGALGSTLRELGRSDEAAAIYRQVLAKSPRDAAAHRRLAYELNAHGMHDEAVAECREAIRLKPGDALAHNNLADSLKETGDLGAAMRSIEEALRLDPENGLSRATLAEILLLRGRFAEAVPALERAAMRLAATEWRRHAPTYEGLLPKARWLKGHAAALKALAGPDVADGKESTALDMAVLARGRGQPALAARLFDVALTVSPTQALDLKAGQRHAAACAAALAGSGGGEDDPRPDDAERAGFRRLALDWLKADLAAWSARLTADPKVVAQLRHWKEDTDLAGIRDPGAVDKLPVAEREAWRTFWADVDALLKRAHAAHP
jgi:serine/threonine protein kinase/tetratricopeptide (TPR) repeat protein